MLDKLIGGHRYGNGYGHKDHRSSGYAFQEHKKFMSYEESEGGYFDRQSRYDHHMRLPANYGRPPMAHMPVFDEEDSDSDVEDFYKSSQSHRTTVLPNHGKNHHQQPPHMNFMTLPPMTQFHHNGKMGNGWQGMHEDAYHGGYGMQQHGAQGMEHQDRLMAPQVPPHHVYMNPSHGSGSGHAVMFKASENWRFSNYSGGHHKAGWRNKGL
ncbi:glycine-rich protein [Raphanus sativus]|uniref:Uncharacterized protein LOC108825385 n=1 Tax=Raphanus sativus TaxID=3726 RepID=A0A6J0L3Y7_RAPSA|nr:uncharacterized protein LOC108825385 [Raphanus sativus]KAJ4909795.1 glycine-rich protein [Raphanus sativus]